MRQKHNAILPGFLHDNASDTKTLKIVQNIRDEYKRVDEYLKTDVPIELAFKMLVSSL